MTRRNDEMHEYKHEYPVHVTVDDFFADLTTPEEELKASSHSPIPVVPELAIALGVLGLVFVLTAFSPTSFSKPAISMDTQIHTVLEKPTETSNASLDIFEDVRLTAEAAVVWDVANQRMLFNKNADTVLPLASITKLMTTLIAYELVDPETLVTITDDTLTAIGNTGFSSGESLHMRDLADMTLIASLNDGASILSSLVAEEIDPTLDKEKIFVEAMNVRARELGLSNTMFRNTTGLDISPTVAGAYGTARETALLMEHILLNMPAAVARTAVEVINVYNREGEHHVVKNTNKTVGAIEGLIASKTGYTALAGGNLVIAFNAGLDRPIIIAVLGSTYYDRFNDTLVLVRKTQELLTTP